MTSTLDFDGTTAKLMTCVKTPPKVFGQPNWGVTKDYPALELGDGTIFVGLIKLDQIGGMYKYLGGKFSAEELEKYFQPTELYP